MTRFVPCALIPTYNHVGALDRILARLSELSLPAIVVDDGNALEAARRIEQICKDHGGTERLRHEFNEGKGFAVLRGLARAAERGFSHAIQIDADGQHDIARVVDLLAAARAEPAALVLGEPRFDETIPRARRLGRQLTKFWVGVNTHFAGLTDTMCGFRAYPVEPTLALARQEISARRMDFDAEVVVRWYWRGMPIRCVPVSVCYPEANISNFDMVRDNVRISAMHARLFFGMLVRMPRLLRRRFAHSGRDAADILSSPLSGALRWNALAERGAYWGLCVLAGAYALLGRGICLILMYPVVTYFFITGHEQRRASREFLRKARACGYLHRDPTLATSHAHFQVFGRAALDKFAAWTGRISYSDIDNVGNRLPAATDGNGRGAVVITAHLGNADVLRAIASVEIDFPVNVLVHTIHAQRFNRLIERVAPESLVRMIQVSRVGPDTIMWLNEAVDRGEWVVVAGDRIALGETGDRVVYAPFLGQPAPFPQGPMVLAALLRCPAYLLICLRDGHRFRVNFEKLADQVILPRHRRVGALEEYVATFVAALEKYVAEDPLQWFNFYDFWHPSGISRAPQSDGRREAILA